MAKRFWALLLLLLKLYMLLLADMSTVWPVMLMVELLMLMTGDIMLVVDWLAVMTGIVKGEEEETAVRSRGLVGLARGGEAEDIRASLRRSLGTVNLLSRVPSSLRTITVTVPGDCWDCWDWWEWGD